MEWINEIKFDENGLVPIIAQDYHTGEVLMLAYTNLEALGKTLKTGKMHYFSRSRQKLWLKGETSGHIQTLLTLYYDCDIDSLLAVVKQEGEACHTGNRTCFYRVGYGAESYSWDHLKALYSTSLARKENPKAGSYTNYLFDKGIDKILKKVGEESAEVIIAAKNNSKDEITYETADLLYHLSVMLADRGVRWEDVYAELARRRKP
ncbi:MAG: bifunctional phosphoribosyl-AMP cyclohydrolase/phosphoribosyl-ATP diphosphatase HisIE [Clostridiales bacterium]|jgi:phosphoribosyl-ATP pyrophosphohydrolase/phosphoribosyl-AMP cyclohydrolase|nr:bifunctional phosphoribosyl-AMP cyclohydrolase/phosphoribosyl-ATP diphosphatase HisIE [Clostridiales bacterium]